MKLADVLTAELAGVVRVLDAGAGNLDLRSHLLPPEGMPYERLDPGAVPELRDGDLLVMVLGPDRTVHGDPGAALSSLAALPIGGRAVVLMGYAAAELPPERILGSLSVARCRLVRLAETEDDLLPAITVVERIDRLPGALEAVGDDALPVVLELLNARMLSEFIADRLAARRQERAASIGDPGQRRIAELETELARATRAIQSLEASASLRVGRLVVGAARSRRAVIRLPVELLRLARQRGGPRQRGGHGGDGARGDGSARQGLRETASVEGPGHRFLAYSGITIGARERLSIAGILRPSTAAAIAPDALVNTLLPHDGSLVLERAEPDLLIVETAAFRAGLPWAFTGDPAATERERSMVEILALAHGLGCPVILWRNTPDHESIGLVHLESRFDLVVPEPDGQPLADWSLGVQLADANPIGVRADRSLEPVLVGRWDMRAPLSLRRALESALHDIAGLSIIVDAQGTSEAAFPGSLAPLVRGRLEDEASATFRRHAIVVADPFPLHRGSGEPIRLLEQVACGARAVMVGRAVVIGRATAPGLDTLVVSAASPADLPEAVARAVAAGPSTEAEQRSMLRTLYRRWATVVRLDALRRRLLLQARPIGARSVTVVAAPATEAEADSLVDDLLLQEERPTEVLLTGPTATDGWGERLTTALGRASIPARVIGPGADAVAVSDSAWLWPWTPAAGLERTTLVDLLVAAEMARPDAVTLTDGPTGFGVPLERGCFLVRRSMLAGETPASRALDTLDPDGWLARGARTFGLAASSGEAGR